jgi:hypothetical protein
MEDMKVRESLFGKVERHMKEIGLIIIELALEK